MTTGTAITGSGIYAPPNAVSTEELCDSFNRWARSAGAQESAADFVHRVSGIESRRFVDAAGVLDPERMCPDLPDRPDDAVSVQAEIGLHAAQAALESAGRSGEEVDLVIVAASSLQRPYPALAIEILDGLGARGAAYDLSVGCSSGSYGIEQASHALRAGAVRCALVVTPEIPSAYSNFRDRDSHFILGDAAAAVVLEPVENAKKMAFEILSGATLARYSSSVRNNGGFLNRCAPETRDAPDKLFYQDGRKVFGDIVRLVPRFVREQLGQAGLTPEEVSRFWLHQANGRMNEAIVKRLVEGEIGDRAPLVLSEYGNTAAAGALLAFEHHKHEVPVGGAGVLCSFGAGYTIGCHVLRRVS